MAETGLSIVIPIRNAASFLGDALLWTSTPGIIKHGRRIEVILVDDNSCDDLLSVLANIKDPLGLIRYVKNPGSGKISALNYGYSLSRGRCVKFIDADDVLESAWFTLTEAWKQRGLKRWAEAHGGMVVDEDLKPIAVFKPPSFAKRDEAFRDLVSVPRWSWCLSRDLCDKLFPLPPELPFEDVWIAAGVARWSDTIRIVPDPVYLYRQHNRQTYGGALVFSREVVTFRCRRMHKVIECITAYADRFGMNESDVASVLMWQTDYWRRLEDYDAGMLSVINSPLPNRLKLKILLQQKAPRLCGWAIRMKWHWDDI